MKESTAKVICAVLLVLIACVNIATFEIISHQSQSAAPTASALASVEDNYLAIADKSDEDSDSSEAEDESSTSSESSEGTTSSTETTEESSPSCCSYCGSQNHSYDHCAQHSIDNGAIGRWVIPSVGINVATYQGFTGTGPDKQEMVDRWDSAVYWLEYDYVPLLADHSNQEFSTLKYVSVGDEAYMDYGSYKQRYVCTEVAYGHNDRYAICDDNWTPLYNYDINIDDIICYTCNGHWENVILVSFQPVA